MVPREFYGNITDITKNCDLGMSETGGLKLQNEHSKIDVHGDSDYWPVDFFGGPIFRQSPWWQPDTIDPFLCSNRFPHSTVGVPQIHWVLIIFPIFSLAQNRSKRGKPGNLWSKSYTFRSWWLSPFHPFLGTHGRMALASILSRAASPMLHRWRRVADRRWCPIVS